MLPRAILEPILFSVIVFFIAGLFGGIVGCLQFCIPVIACAITATAYGCLISAAFESVATGTLASVPIEQIWLIYCGLFIALSNVPFPFYLVKYMSMFYYGIEAVSILQWTQINYIPCSDIEGAPCISSGEGVLQNYGYSSSNFGYDLLGLGAIYFVSHLIGYLAFWKRSKQQAVY